MTKTILRCQTTAVLFLLGFGHPSAQSGPVGEAVPSTGASSATTNAAPAVPGYVIGPDDVLSIVFWREKDMSGDVVVRPDGRISLPLINEVEASGLTPEQLRQKLSVEAERYVQDPSVTVVVKEIKSRRVFITGEVNRPGPYPLMAPTTVLQLISTAGGLLEYAKRDKIVVMRTENGQPVRLQFDYDGVVQGRNLRQNVELRPGDTVIVP
jgi:polysaccharide export outer membrane protein